MNVTFSILHADVSRVSPSPFSVSAAVVPSCLFFAPFQCFHVPYSALTMFLSTDQKERDSATAYRKSTR